MSFLRGAGVSYLAILCAKTLTVHRSNDLELLMTVPLPTVTCFAVNDGMPFPGLAVTDASTLYLYNLQYGFEMCKPFSLPEQPMALAWSKDFVCVGYKEEYSLMSEINGSIQLLTNTGGATPICRTLPMEEVLAITRSGALITQPIGWKVEAFKLTPPVRSIAFSFPFLFALCSKSSSSEASIEIRSVLDTSFYEILRLPPSINAKGILHLTDDSLNVFLLDQHNLYSIIPNTLTAHSLFSGPLAVSEHHDASTPRKQPTIPSDTTPTSKSSKDLAKSNTPLSARAKNGIFTFTTTMSSPLPASNAPEQLASSDKLHSSQPASTFGTPLSTPPRSAGPQDAKNSFEMTQLPNASIYIIPAPLQNDKNSFIRYIRTVLKQEHNPYRLLLVAYATKVSQELSVSALEANAKLEEAKKCVGTYLRRFLRTFSLEFKQYQSKTMRELLTVAVAVAFHALLAPTLLPIINSICSDQDKVYNEKLASLHHTGFHPSQFEVPTKFWLTHDSVTAEQEKEAIKRLAAQAQLRTSSGADASQDAKSENKTENFEISKSSPSETASQNKNRDGNSKSSREHTSPIFATDAKSLGEATAEQGVSSPDPTTLQPSSLKRYFQSNPSLKPGFSSTDDGSGSSATDDGEEYAIDFRPMASGLTPTDRFTTAMKSKPEMKPNTSELKVNAPEPIRAKVVIIPNSNNSERASLGEAKLYCAEMSSREEESMEDEMSSNRAKGRAREPILSAAEFVLLDVVFVSYDPEHHLYFTFPTGVEKELAPSEWNFLFKDEEKAIYWHGSDNKMWRLGFPKKQRYVEFTARYRLYETQANSSSGTGSALNLANSYSQPSFLTTSVSAGSTPSSHLLASTHGRSSSIDDRSRSNMVTSIEFSLDSATTSDGPSPPDTTSLSTPTHSGNKSDQLALKEAKTHGSKLDLRRMALEQSVIAATPTASTPTSMANRSMQQIGSNDSPRLDSPQVSFISTPLGSTPSSPHSQSNTSDTGSMNTSNMTPRMGQSGQNQSTTNDYPYCSAVRTLRLVSKLRTPREKIETMARALSYVTQAVDEFWAPHGKKVIVGADDLVPIFSYVVALAKVPSMYSEMSYALEFSNESSLRGKYGYSIATLQICVEHVVQVASQLESERENSSMARVSEGNDVSVQSPIHTPGTVSPAANTDHGAFSPHSSASSAGIAALEAGSSTTKPNSQFSSIDAHTPLNPPSYPSSPPSLSDREQAYASQGSQGGFKGDQNVDSGLYQSPVGSAKLKHASPTQKNDARSSMRVQDLIGKMATMTKMKRASSSEDAASLAHHHSANVAPESSSTYSSMKFESDGTTPSAGMMSSESNSMHSSAVASPALSPIHSRPTTPSPLDSIQIGEKANAQQGIAGDPNQQTFPCSALEVSQPQIDGQIWITSESIQFEGTYKDEKRTVRVALLAILALKKSWGMFGGEGIDIYAKKDVIVFFRHFSPSTRDVVYDQLISALNALGHSITVK